MFTQKTLFVAQLGSCDRAEVSNAIGLANQLQNAFLFDGLFEQAFDLKPYALANGAYDFDGAVPRFLKRAELKAPGILVTRLPYGEREDENDPEAIYFSGLHPSDLVCTISTYLWSSPSAARPIQPYLLHLFGASILSLYAGLDYHQESRACVMDYCDKPTDIEAAIANGDLCSHCMQVIDRAVSENRISLAEFGAARKLLARAKGQKRAFVIMPFDKKHEDIYIEGIRPALRRRGWNVVRADAIAWPRLITDAVLLEILSADLVVAVLTDLNPNVFYELGLSDAFRADIIMCMAANDERIPFDVSTRKAVLYDPADMKAFRKELGEVAQSGKQ